MSLSTYHQKRDFTQTSEPKGGNNADPSGPGYLIQKHDASRLHYDFRLQVDGVLKSWAIPKGPSLSPKDKRLAVETEDHPLDYGDFEGTIPPDNYGAGTVMLWDRGEWRALGDVKASLSKGKLSFELHGERLKGRWALIKMRGSRSTRKDWLLVKEDDEFATESWDPTEAFQDSVVTHRSMHSIATDGHGNESSDGATGTSKVEEKLDELQDIQAVQSLGREKAYDQNLDEMRGAIKSAFPQCFKPQLATLYKTVPDSNDWIHEIKYDGYRLLAMRQGSKKPRLYTRNSNDWTDKFPAIAEAFESLPDSIIDGELVYLDESGISNFEDLQSVLKTGDLGRLVFYAFDIPYLQGFDLRHVPLLKRKALLAKVIHSLDEKRVVFSDHFESNGQEIWSHACEHGLEGIISKKADSPYENSRSRSWRKAKCTKRQEFVICGYTPPKRSRKGFGSLLLGYWEGDRLLYAGRVGTGFTDMQLLDLTKDLDRRRRKQSPLNDKVDDASESDVAWVKPNLVAEVEFTEWTTSKRLRHPSFIALRADKPAKDIVREVPLSDQQQATAREDEQKKAKSDTETSVSETRSTAKTITAKKGTAKKGTSKKGTVEIAGVTLTSPDKPLYPNAGIAKQDLAEYYVAVAEHIFPQIGNRPLTLVRCPQGFKRHCFFQKHLGDTFDPSIKDTVIEEKKGPGTYAYVDSLQGLIGLVQMGTLEIHAWGSRADDPEKPDSLVFDLDPDEGVTWQDIKQGAFDVRDCLSSMGLASFVRTSGGKGLHVVVPVSRRHSWDEVKEFSRAIADRIAEAQPQQYIATASKAKRQNKIFIDYLRNGRGATSVCSFSTRSRPGAPVATPIAWSELADLESPQAYRLDNVPHRLNKLKHDPWDGYDRVRQSITKPMKQKLGLE